MAGIRRAAIFELRVVGGAPGAVAEGLEGTDDSLG